MHVVVAQDGVDGQLSAESAEVARGGNQSLEGKHGGQDAGEGRLLDDLGGRGGDCGSLVTEQNER